MNKALKHSAQYRWAVASRVLAASVGGYALTSLVTADVALLLPRVSNTAQAEGVLIATLWSFTLYTIIVLWVFATGSASRAWTGIAAASILASMTLKLLKGWL